MKRLLFILLLMCAAYVRGEVKVSSLRTNFMSNPMMMDKAYPMLSWQFSSSIPGYLPQDFQVFLYSDEACKKQVFASGWQYAQSSPNSCYLRFPVQPFTRYYWRVALRGGGEKETLSSENAFFETGLMDQPWTGAEWIRLPKPIDRDTTTQLERYELSLDLLIERDDACIIFGAQDPANFLMWGITTKNNQQPALRRHVYEKGQLRYTDVSIANKFSREALIGKPHRVTIGVEKGTVTCAIDGVIVDKYQDEKIPVEMGSWGLRSYNGNGEQSLFYVRNVQLVKKLKEKSEEVVYTSVSDTSKVFALNDVQVYTKDGVQWMQIEALRPGEIRHIAGLSESGLDLFKYNFRVRKTVASARVYVTSLGMFDLFLNGNRIGVWQSKKRPTIYDELKPGWTDYSKTVHYYAYDITPWVQQYNVMGAELSGGWWNGAVNHGRYGVNDLYLKLMIRLVYTDGTEQTIGTNGNWYTQRGGAVRYGDIYGGESYDARLEIDWAKRVRSERGWEKAIVCKTLPCAKPFPKVTALIGPTVRVRQQLTRKAKSVSIYSSLDPEGKKVIVTRQLKGTVPIKLKKGETAIFDMAQNLVGWVSFTVKGAEGTKMRFRFGEMLNDSGESLRGNDGPAGSLYTANLRSAKCLLEYILKGNPKGESYHPRHTFFGFRYCELSADQDVEISQFRAQVVGSDTQEGSSFECSNPIVNQLYRNTLWGQRSNFLSIPTDCPQRDERLGWTGDTQVFSRAACYNADCEAFYEKWMGDMRDSQHENGAFPDVAPYNWVGYGNSGWAEAGIIVPWNTYLVYGNKRMLYENYPAMEKYLSFLQVQKDEKWQFNGAHTAYGDWLSYESTDKRFISVCYYAYAAQLMSKMAKALGDSYKNDVKRYEQLYDSIKAEFAKRYLNSQGDLVNNTSQTAYLLTLKLNLYPDDAARKRGIAQLVEKIKANGNKLSTGFLGTSIINQTLSEVGESATAYDLLLQRSNPSWLYSIDQGATTIWERWDSYTKERGFGDVGMNSFNHYAYGVIVEWMFRYMAGIDVDENQAGFSKFVLQPKPDWRTEIPAGQERIEWVKARYASIKGMIESEWRQKKDGRLRYKAVVPTGTTATLYFPLRSKTDRISVNGKPVQSAKGVIVKWIRDNEAILELESGHYVVDASE